MHRKERSFAECFCVVFIRRYSFFHCRPLNALNVHLHFLQKECFRTAQSKVSFNSVSWMHRTESSFTECFCVVFICRYSFFHCGPLIALNVHLQFLQKGCFRTSQSKVSFNPVSWMHRTERNFTECFCVVFIWRYPFFHYRPFSAPNVNLQFLQKECFRIAQSKVSFNSVSWMNGTERRFTECFCVLFIWRYSFFHYRPLSAPNVQLQFLQKGCFTTPQSKVRFNSVRWMHRSESSFTECLCVVLRGRYCVLHRMPQYPLADSTKRVFQKCSIKSKLQLC